MSNTKQDRAKVAGGQDHEVRHEADKTGASKDEVTISIKRSPRFRLTTSGRRPSRTLRRAARLWERQLLPALS